MTHSKTLPQTIRQLLCILVAAVAAAGFAHAQQPTLRIATEGTYPPWSFKDADGKLQGWDVDIANALCEKMRARCEVVAQDWDGIIPGLVARKFDLIVASMAITEQRRQKVDFSDKYKDTISRFVAKKGTPADISPAALKGKAIGVQRGSIQASYLSQNYKEATLKFYDTPQAAELDLVAGRVDYILGNMVTYFVGFLKSPEAASFDFVGPDLKGGLLGDGNGIAVRKGDTAMVDSVNAALAAIRADGTYDRITAKYFPFKLM
jgi:polar amino acid transport system substrate-binding protein/arginine/ornithine transport system substrate-binding protein